MIRLWRAKQNDRLVLTYALAAGQVSLAIAEFASDDANHAPALIVSDHQAVENGQWQQAVKSLTEKYARYSKGNPQVVIVLGPSLYQSVQLERPNVPNEEITQALRYKLRDLVSLEPQNIIADFYEAPVQLPGQSKINAIVADKRMLQSVVAEIHTISTNLVGIVAEEQAIAQMFTGVEEAAVVAHQHQQEPALLQVYQQGKLYVNRVVRSLEQLSQLAADEIELGGAAPLSVEVQRSADYFERQLRQRPISQVILAIASQQRAAISQQIDQDLGLQSQWATYPEWAQELATGDFSDFPVLGGVLISRQLVKKAAVAA